MNRNYNRQALDFALEIVNRQSRSDQPLAQAELADPKLIRESEILNELTLREILHLRSQMSDFDGDMELTSIPLEITHSND